MSRTRTAALLAGGVAVAAAFIMVAGAPKNAHRVLAMLAVASAAFLAIVFALGSRDRARRVGAKEMITLALFGLVARAALIPADPVLEDDVYRYLWDGAVLASGQSPYAFSPQQVYDARIDRPLPDLSATDRASVAKLAQLSRDPDLDDAFAKINYPSVPTIYPPVAMAQFAALAKVAPGSVTAVKISLMALELACVAGLLLILASIGAPRAFALLYWLNPLPILSFAGSAHMDILPMALLTLAIALALRRRALAAGALLGLAAAAKLFPIAAWLGLRRHLGVRGTAVALVVTLSAYALIFHPRMFEGLQTFAKLWQINGALHALLDSFLGSASSRVIALLAAALVAVATANRRPLVALTCAIAALVLASPAINPWYVAWLVPFAAALRSIPLLVLSLTVLASYLRFIWGELPGWLPWIEFGIPLLMGLVIHLGRPEQTQPTEIGSSRDDSEMCVTKP